jgi:hypothetical protein
MTTGKGDVLIPEGRVKVKEKVEVRPATVTVVLTVFPERTAETVSLLWSG